MKNKLNYKSQFKIDERFKNHNIPQNMLFNGNRMNTKIKQEGHHGRISLTRILLKRITMSANATHKIPSHN